MHCPGERCLLPPHPKFLPEPLPPHLEPLANTCHPLSVTKSPAPRWHSCPQAALSPPGATRVSLLPCQPLLQQCLVLRPEPGDTARLLPLPRVTAVPKALATPESPRGDKQRAARSLPPCAVRCPEPRKLRYPPCAVRSSASCRGHCRSHKVAKCPQRRAELTSGYSAPLRGVTECPPQAGAGHSSFLQELLAQHRCSRGYPTQECVTGCSSELSPECRQRQEVTAKVAPGVTKVAPGVTKVAPEVTKVAPGVTKVAPAVTKVAPGVTKVAPAVTKVARSSAQVASKPRCALPRSSPRPARLAAAGAKRSAHGKKSRCASRWLW